MKIGTCLDSVQPLQRSQGVMALEMWLDTSHSATHSVLCKLRLVFFFFVNSTRLSTISVPRSLWKSACLFLLSQDGFCNSEHQIHIPRWNKSRERNNVNILCLYPISQDHATCSPLAAREPEKLFFIFQPLL